MQVFHVNLSATTTGHTGSSADPMSWADVRARLLALPATPSAVDLVFRCRGTGALLSTEQAVTLTGLQFTSPTGGIRFVADDAGRYGLPVIKTPVFGAGVTALQTNQAWFKLTSTTGVRLDFTGFVFDIEQPFGSDGYSILEASGGVGSVVNASNNIIVERGVGHRFVYVHGTDTTAKTVTAGNTVCFGTTSSGAQEFARVETGRLFTGLNYAVQSPTSPAVVMFTTALHELYTHANAFALRASSVLYTGVAPNRYGADVIGINPTAQGVYNIDAIDNGQPAPAIANGLSYSEASGFWPVHGGHLLRLGAIAIPASLDLSATTVDAFGYSRPAATQDAGAVQKSGRTEPGVVHVDLSSAMTGGGGSEDSPIGRDEFLVDYGRRAPVDYQLTYVMRGSNTQAPFANFDTGPLSPNAAAADITYNGSGQVKLTGYKTYNRSLPVFSARRITPNAHLLVILERMKLEFAGGVTDFIAGDLLNNVSVMRIRACVMRSRAAAVGLFLRVDASTTPVHLRGCTINQGHSNGTSSGLFSHVGAGDVHLCAINLLNQTVAGVGNASVSACSISTGGAGTATWPGAVIDAFTKLNAVNAFVDPDNASYEDADFRLTGVSDAIGILPDVTAATDTSDLAQDCRGMIRSAFPNGSTAGDAGAYEYNFHVPEPEHRYLDLGKNRSGEGTPTDRWSPEDLQAWCSSLAATSTLLTRTIIVHTARSGRMDLVLSRIEADPNGALVFVADNGVPLWESSQANNIAAADSTGLAISVRGLMLRNDTGAEVVVTRNCADTTVDMVNTIVDVKHATTSYRVVVITQPVLADVLTVTAATTRTFRVGIDYQLGDTPADTAAAIAAAITAAGEAAAVAVSDALIVSVPLAGAVSATGTGLGVAVIDAAIDVDTVTVRGCSFNDEFQGESGLTSTVIRATTADVGYSAFQGHAFSTTTKSGVAVQAAAGSSYRNRVNAVTSITAGGVTDSGSSASASPLFAVPRAPDTTVDAFVLAGTDCQNVLDVPTLPAVLTGVDQEIDILGHYRSRVYVNSAQDKYDAGAVETNYLSESHVFTGEVGNPLAEVTAAGYALNSRALAGDVHFSLVGYAFARGGYVYWDPTKPQPAQDPGAQAKAVVRVTGTVSSGSVTVTGPLGSVTVTAGVDFDTGATPAASAAAIATALRSKPLFNKGFWCNVDGAYVNIYSWRFGSSAGSCTATVTDAAITRVQNFVTGPDLLGVQDPVYPTTGYAPWFGAEVPDPRSIGLIVRLEDGEFVYGELAVIARVHSSVFDDEVDTDYVYARVRMPISVKYARRTLIQHVLFAF